MTLSEFGTVVGIGSVALAAMAWIADKVLANFHSKHVTPTIAKISADIKANTVETSRLNERMAENSRDQRESQAESKALTDRLVRSAEDHEIRITLNESHIANLQGEALKRPRPARKRT